MLTGDCIFSFGQVKNEAGNKNENTKRKTHLIAIFNKLGVPTNDSWEGIES
jgi:hypothetical protein